MVLETIIGSALGIGSSIFGGITAGNQQAKAEARASSYEKTTNAWQVGKQEESWGKLVDQVNEQLDFNNEAAQRAYMTEQEILNEQFAGAAFQNQEMLRNLLEVQGSNNASERYGRSTERLNDLNSLGRFGNQQAILAANLSSARGQTRRNMDDVRRQYITANRQAAFQLKAPPGTTPLMPTEKIGSGSNAGLMIGQIGSALLDGYKAFKASQPPPGYTQSLSFNSSMPYTNSFNLGIQGLPNTPTNYSSSFSKTSK